MKFGEKSLSSLEAMISVPIPSTESLPRLKIKNPVCRQLSGMKIENPRRTGTFRG
jgi:hypothetical protein